MKKTALFAAICAASFCSVSSFAAESAPQKKPIALDEIVISGSAGSVVMPDPIIETYVIGERELSQVIGGTIFDALRFAPGIDVNQNGGVGQNSSIFIRGNRSESTLVLIDGMRYGQISSGSAQLGLIPIDTIERIEVYYGAAAAARYGSDATGGVIQVFTKTASKPGFSGGLRGSFGSGDTFSSSASAGYRSETFDINVTGGTLRDEGISSVVDENNFRFEPDKDGFKSDFASLAARVKLSDKSMLRFSGVAASSNAEYDSGDPEQGTNVDLLNQSGNLEFTHREAGYLLSASHGISVDKAINNTLYPSDFKTRQDLSKIYLHKDTDLALLSAGVERLKQDLVSESNSIDRDRILNSAVLGAVHEGRQFEASITGRLDHVEGGETKQNGSVGAAVYLTPTIKTGVQAARSYRLPTFNDLFFPYGANPDLKAEQSRYYEVFGEYAAGKQSLRLSGYRTEVDDFILLDQSYVPQNIANARLLGVSVSGKAKLGFADLGAGYDYLDATDTETGQDLPYRANHKANASIGAGGAGGYGLLQAKWTDHRPSSNRVELDSYWLVDASFRQTLSDWAAVTYRIDNLLDEDYQLVDGFGTSGIEASLALDLNW